MVIHILYPYSANRIVSSAKQIVSSRKVGNTMYINYLFLFYHDAILLFIFAFGFLEIIEQILFFTLGYFLIWITIFLFIFKICKQYSNYFQRTMMQNLLRVRCITNLL